MKKNIVILLLILTTLSSLVYGFVQRTAALAAQKEALMNLELAESAEKTATQSRQEALVQSRLAVLQAEANYVEAMKQKKLYEELLKKGKK